MSALPVRLYSGVPAIKAADEVRKAAQDRREDWPYVHIYPPPNSIDVNEIGTIVTQDPAADPVTVVSHTVPSGKQFFLTAVLLGSNATVPPGDALFTIDRNSPDGVTNAQFMPEQGFIAVPVALGSLLRPWRLQRAREFKALDIIRVKATNVAMPVGDPTFWVCGLFGYEVPVLAAKGRW